MLKYLVLQYLLPLVTGKPTRSDKVLELEGEMIESLDLFENVWLKDKRFLAGDRISIADLLGASEVEQPSNFKLYYAKFIKTK